MVGIAGVIGRGSSAELDDRGWPADARGMSKNADPWMSTEDVAREAGMTTEWVRRQIQAGRLGARVWSTGRRSTYRIRRSDWLQFRALFSRRSDEAHPGD